MKVTLNWLKDYADFEWSAEQLAERLTMLGLEVEGLQRLGGGFEGILVGQVMTRDKHPNADKLSVCRVQDGLGERQVVCGAHNFQPGDKVALILPGATLPPKAGETAPLTIKVGKIRGVESHGMMCSAEELGLDPESLGLRKEDGILVLRPDATVGQPFARYLGQGESDVLYDLEITPNRPDLNSVIGIAREIAALTGNALRLPEIPDAPARPGPTTESLVEVRLEAPDLCPRYTARILQGVKVGPSPDWLRQRLERIGLRSINNVVDVTNYVMLETGQPLHAFDYHGVARGEGPRPTVLVRRAVDGEKFVTLDGREHRLTPECLLIADPEKGIALAGVMGGRNTEISERTADVLLESAYFSPTNIRRTSKALGLRTDSSYRFERGADIGATDWASRRAVHLILQCAGGTAASGVVDAYPSTRSPRLVALRYARANALLGLALSSQEIDCFLGQLGLKSTNRQPRPIDDPTPPETGSFQVPSFRVDLSREVDLIEEVARLYGADRIPSTPPRLGKGAHPFDARYDEGMEFRRLLSALGLNEAQGQTLISHAAVRDLESGKVARLANPLSQEMDALRPSLIPGLLDILRHNVRHKNPSMALFEIGRVFRRATEGVGEHWQLAIALSGARHSGFWTGADREARFELADLKGLLEELFDQAGLRGVSFQRRTQGTDLFAESATLTLGGKLALGELGLLQPRLARQYDLRDSVLLAELNLEAMSARRTTVRTFKSLPAFPAIRRDVSLIVAEPVTHEAVLQAARQAKPAHLEGIELFDVFRGGHVPEGHKSVAYSFTYRAPDRTLTDAEVTAAHSHLVKTLEAQLSGLLRG